MFSPYNRMVFSPRSKDGTWYQSKTFKAEESGERVAQIDIYDAIDPWGVSAEELVGFVRNLEADTIRVNINSPGGSVFDGNAIANAFRSHPAKTVMTVDGVAASIASTIWAAGDERFIHDNAWIMIHNTWAMSVGNARELRETAALLERLDGTLISTYDKIFPTKSTEEIEAMLDAETWLNATDVRDLEAGLIVESAEAQAKGAFDLSFYSRVPAELLETSEAARAHAAAKAAEAPAATYVSEQDRLKLRARLAAMGVASPA